MMRSTGRAGVLLLAAASLAFALPAQGQTQVVFSQPPNPAGGLIVSSWVDPNGSDADMYVYDDFTLGSDHAIIEIDWRGGYTQNQFGGPVTDFSVTFFESIAGGSQPHVANPQLEDVTPVYLVKHYVGGNAGETPVGSFGGVTMYDYKFVLPTPFQAAGGTKYWVRIEASQGTYPDWGIAVGTGGDGQHFRFSTGAAQFQFGSGDAAFTLLASAGPSYTITTSASPANGGTVSGGGAYPSGSTATVVATPNPGYGFVSWTENGVPVSTSATYMFAASADRTLVANFTAAYTITTSASPSYGGSTSGDGTYNSGSSVTVVATSNAGYRFVNWTESGAPVSTSAGYTFTAVADRTLVANFAPGSTTATFDFDTGTPTLFTGQGLPLDQTSGGVTAHFSSPTVGAGGFSVQSDASTQYHLSQFSGNYLWPNSVYSPALDIQFSQQLSSITFTFATADFQQVEIPTTIQLTAYENSTATPAVGSATAHGTYAGDTMPMGTLTFNSPTPFNVVQIAIPPAPAAASGFLVDNVIVTTTALSPTATPTNTATPAPTPTPTQCVGDCGRDGIVTVDELLTIVNIALGNAAVSLCTPGDANGDQKITVDEILAAVNHALNGCGTG
jgi:hypothetical protein